MDAPWRMPPAQAERTKELYWFWHLQSLGSRKVLILGERISQ